MKHEYDPIDSTDDSECECGLTKAAHITTSQEEVLETYRLAAEKFIAKCESGRAFSQETYADLKKALDLHKRVAMANVKLVTPAQRFF